MRTIGARRDARDAGLFVGRGPELEVVDGLFAPDTPAVVAHIHGPAGIGKSALLREIARRGVRAGWTVHRLDGSDLPPLPGALEMAVHPARYEQRPLILLDTYERMAALDGYLRSRVLLELPERTLVVTAGRRPPAPGWFCDGWENVTVELPLAALSRAESLELLRRHGVGDDGVAAAIAAWSAGSPLALSMLADAAITPGGRTPGRGSHEPARVRRTIARPPPEVAQALSRRLLDAELEPGHLDTLAVGSIARTVTPALLAAVAPEADAAASIDWLLERSFVDVVPGGVRLHELVRRAVRAELRVRDPMLERDLRRRVADHLHAAAVEGNLLLTIDLADLTENELVRSGYGWDGSTEHRVDPVRAGDAEEVAGLLGDHGSREWWEGVRAFFEQAPETISLARDGNERLCGYSVAVTLETAPACAYRDPVLAAWLAHARTHSGDAVLWREVWDFTRDAGRGVRAMVALSGVLRSGLPNPRYAYLPIDPGNAYGAAFSAELGGRHLLGLDAHVAGRHVHCHLVDYGPGGLLGAQRDLVYREIGLAPPPPGGEDAVSGDSVREALRLLQQPGLLAASPLANGATPAERAASVRRLLEEATDGTFGETPDERLLRAVLERAYLDPAPNLDIAAEELHVSRATYFRRLRTATDRLASYVVAASETRMRQG